MANNSSITADFQAIAVCASSRAGARPLRTNNHTLNADMQHLRALVVDTLHQKNR